MGLRGQRSCLEAIEHHLNARNILCTMQKLKDKEIRHALLANLGRRANLPRATLEEVHVCNGNAIADVVAVYKAMHCYEIKGETDSINRVVRQSQFYDQAFPLISLVTTTNHIRRAEIIVPKHWGIVLANSSPNASVTFKHVRGAIRNPSYHPEIALLSLWRSELIKFPNLSNASLERMNRQKIAALIASSIPARVINELVGQVLAARNSSNTKQDNLLPCTRYERKLLASESLMG
jgi:hypothetical protein